VSPRAGLGDFEKKINLIALSRIVTPDLPITTRTADIGARGGAVG